MQLYAILLCNKIKDEWEFLNRGSKGSELLFEENSFIKKALDAAGKEKPENMEVIHKTSLSER